MISVQVIRRKFLSQEKCTIILDNDILEIITKKRHMSQIVSLGLQVNWKCTGGSTTSMGIKSEGRMYRFEGELSPLRSALALRALFKGFTGFYTILQHIGTDSRGDTFLASMIDDTKCAVQVVKHTQRSEQNIVRQIDIMRELAASSVFPMPYELFAEGGHLLFIQEYSQGLSLRTILKNYLPMEMPLFKTRVIMQLLEALARMKEAQVVHLDIQPANIIIDQHCGCQLTTFDCAIDLSNFAAVGPVGTAGYIAPELFLQSTHHYDCQNDMFSLGCVFFEMLVGRKLFFEGISLTVMELNAEGYICINTDEICDAKAEDLLRRMLRSQPANRITVEMALMHPFIMDESQGSMFDEDEPVSIQLPYFQTHNS